MRNCSTHVFDGRNLFKPQAMAGAGFTYYSIGRPATEPKYTATKWIERAD